MDTVSLKRCKYAIKQLYVITPIKGNRAIRYKEIDTIVYLNDSHFPAQLPSVLLWELAGEMSSICQIHFILEVSSIVFEYLKFVTKDELLDSGWWSDVFRNPPRDIPMFCIRCGQQRMHRNTKISPVFEEIFDGDCWRYILVGLYFECVFCLEEADNDG